MPPGEHFMYEISMPTIRDMLLRAMKRKGWDANELARRAGMPPSQIWKYLNPTKGRDPTRPTVPKIDNLRKLVAILDISPEELAGVRDGDDRVAEALPEYRLPQIPPEIVLPVDVYYQLTAALKSVMASAKIRDPVLRKRRKARG